MQGGIDLIPGQGIKIPYAALHCQKKKEKQKWDEWAKFLIQSWMHHSYNLVQDIFHWNSFYSICPCIILLMAFCNKLDNYHLTLITGEYLD